MRLLIDANIILDVLQKREPHYEDSSKVWKLCETDLGEGFVSALSFANLMYVMRRELSPDKIEEIMTSLSLIFEFEDMRAKDVKNAVGMKWEDFEDAVQAATAVRINADYIITRNVKDYRQSKIPALTPTEFLERL